MIYPHVLNSQNIGPIGWGTEYARLCGKSRR